MREPKNRSVTYRASDEGDAPTELQLSTLTPGTVVKVVTLSGSVYWVTPVKDARLAGGYLHGVSIHTPGGGFSKSPHEVRCSDLIRVGYAWRYGRDGRTTPVRSIEIQ